MKHYLSACAVYRDEADYLREWIEFHRLVGFEHFFLYDNNSGDAHREVLAPYVDEGVVTLHDWPLHAAPNLSRPQLEAVQMTAYEHCLAEHGAESRWIAIIDIDEFLFSPTGSTISELLVDYESYPGLSVFWLMFGTSGHLEKPPGLVIENYLHRTVEPRRNAMAKSIVDPRRAARVVNGHYVVFHDGAMVDESGRPLEERVGEAGFVDPDSVPRSRFRINHYWTRSEAEMRTKLTLRTRHEPERIERRIARLRVILNEQYDDAITAYVPALRKALSLESAP